MQPATLPRIAGWLCVAAMLALASPGVRFFPAEAAPAPSAHAAAPATPASPTR